MKILTRLAPWLLALAFVGSAHAAQYPYFRGVTYFGDASPMTFWNSNVQRATEDFKEIKSDGFNSVILVVPWGEFQPSVNPVQFNDEAYTRLAKVCQAAKGQGLHVFVRASYLWDFYPGVQFPNFQRANALLSNDTLMPAWKQYLQRVKAATEQCSHAYFIGWEDFWVLMEWVGFDPQVRATATKERQASFDVWARKSASKAFLKKYEQRAKETGLYPLPDRNSPDYRLVFQWFDDQFIHRLMPAMASILPGSSMEIRSDDDPIYNGKTQIEWFSHHRTYAVKSSPYVMTYWAPAIGAKNTQDVEPADKVLTRFAYIQRKISTHTPNKIFIEQFLFKDNTPEAVRNTQIAPDQIDGFLRKAASPLLKLTSGYSLWGARNYDASLLFNGFFSMGAMGWDLRSGAELMSTGSTKSVRIKVGASVAQTVPLLRGVSPGTAKGTTLRLRITGPGILEAQFAGATVSANVPPGTNTLTLQLPLAIADSDLVLSAQGGTLEITDVYLYFFTFKADVRDPLGNAGPHLDSIRVLNRNLAAGSGMPSRLSADDNTLTQATGVFAREQDGQRWYAWASDKVEARLVARSDAVLVKGYITPSLFKGAKDCTLRLHIDGVQQAIKKYEADGPIDFNVSLKQHVKGSLFDLQITSTCSLKAGEPPKGNDKRNLAFILSEIDSGAQTVK